jgi:hypothetical protein
MPNRLKALTLFISVLLLVTLTSSLKRFRLVYAVVEERSPVHNDPDVYVNGTWFEGDNTTAGANYRDWHSIQWWFEKFGLRNWSQNITRWESQALEWGIFIDTRLKNGANITLPVAVDLVYRNGTVISLPAGSTLELPPDSTIQSYYTLGNLGGGVQVVYPELENSTYSQLDAGIFNETQPENVVVEGYITGKFYRSNVTYLDTAEGKVISWYISYRGCSNLSRALGRVGGGEYDPTRLTLPSALTYASTYTFFTPATTQESNQMSI